MVNKGIIQSTPEERILSKEMASLKLTKQQQMSAIQSDLNMYENTIAQLKQKLEVLTLSMDAIEAQFPTMEVSK